MTESDGATDFRLVPPLRGFNQGAATTNRPGHERAAADADAGAPSHLSTLWLLTVGLITLLGQVVLLREVLVASFGSELIYLLAMGMQMLGTATGAVALRHGASERRLRVLFVSAGVAIPILVALARAIRVIFRSTPGAYLPFFHQLAAIAMVVVPFGVLGGMLFTGAARLHVARSRTLAAAYAIESVGGVLGGAAATLLIVAGVQNLTAALLCSIVAVTAALPGSRGRSLSAVATLLIVSLAFLLARSRTIDRRLTALNHPQLLETRDTPYGRATVTGSHGQVVVFENDALAFESEGTSAEEFVHLAALQVERPRSVLILGGAVEQLAGEVRKHRPPEVRDVEIDRGLVDLAGTYLPMREVPTFDDPRRFLRRPARYDLILSGMPEPDSGQASRFYTREFFAECAHRLAPGGAVAFRLRSDENLWTPALARRTASIVGALRSALPHVIVLPGAVNIVIASNRPLQRDPDVLSRRFRERQIEARLVSPAYLRYVYTNDRLTEVARILEQTPAVPSSDGRPVCYQQTLVLWLSRFFPTLAFSSLTASRTAPALIVLALLIATIASRRWPRLRRTLLVGFAGFAGLVLEGVLILSYQMSKGILYRDLGILLTMFMSGLAAGSWTLNRQTSDASATGAPRLLSSTRAGIVLLLGTAAVAGLTAWSVSSPSQGLVSGALFLFGVGFMTGAIFAQASLRRPGDQSTIAGPLYAADLLGGVAGSIAASLFLIPMAGLAASALLVAALALVALLLR